MCPKRRAMCSKRRSQSSHERYQGPRDLRPHQRALSQVRKKFSQSWAECGKAKKIAERDHTHEGVVEAWLRFVTHKILKRYHHKLSQLLKEVKEIKFRLD